MLSIRLAASGDIVKDHPVGPVQMPHFDLIFVHRGKLKLQIMSRKELQLTSNQAILIYPETSFEGYSQTKRSSVSVIHFTLENHVPPPFKSFIAKERGFELCEHILTLQFRKDIERLIALNFDEHSPHIEEKKMALMNLIFADWQSESMSFNKRMEHANKFDALIAKVRKNLDQPLNLKAMAREVGLSESRFRELFSKYTGNSPGQFQLSLRMHEAGRLLRETDLPIKQVGAMVGYTDPAHFYSRFKRHSHMTPLAYRSDFYLKT